MPITKELHGTAIVCCVHNVIKNAKLDIEFDKRTEFPHRCKCCGNMYADVNDTSERCPTCAFVPIQLLIPGAFNG